MSGETKPVPSGAETLSSFQLYQDTCQGELDRLSKDSKQPMGPLDPKQVVVFNRVPGDGSFELLYQEPRKDFSCSAQVLWSSHELLVRGGRLSNRTSYPLMGTTIPDACAMTEKLAGPEEFAGQSCQEDVSDARLNGSERFTSVQEFSKGCQELYDRYANDKLHQSLTDRFDLKRTRIINPILGEGMYSLRFESHANNFFCEGDVDSSAHTMLLRSGTIAELDSAEPTNVIEMTD